MKNKSSVSKATDSLVAIIQTIILAYIPIVFDSNMTYKVIAYFVVGITIIVYILFFRHRIITAIILRRSIDTDKIKEINAVTVFYNIIIPEIRNLSCNNLQPDDFELLFRFRVWKNAIWFISDHFWENGELKNVNTLESVTHSINAVYKNEVVSASKKLLEIYSTNDFSMIIQSYNCETFEKTINERVEIIKIIANNQ
ncbi:MAG: hypothetical protein J5854_07400 [Clostridia bacterium]|nr:hypothetical protein [Clostridia bacterium]